MKFRNIVISETMESFSVDFKNQPLFLISDLTRYKLFRAGFLTPKILKFYPLSDCFILK